MHKAARGFLMVVSVLNGLSGLVCGVLFIISPDGRLMQAEALLPVIKTLPLAEVFFRDFTWVGIAMLLVLGIPNTLAAIMLMRRRERQYVVTLASGVLLMSWTGFELIFMYNALALGYFVVGAASILCSVMFMKPKAPSGA